MMAMDSDLEGYPEGYAEVIYLSYQRELFREFDEELINWAKVSWLVETCPTICRERHENGWLPLEFAITKNAPLALIKLLVNSWHEHGNPYWIMPLHLACLFDAPLEVIYYLAQEFPDAMDEKDAADRTAFHYVMRANRELDVMMCVAQQWPENESLDFKSKDEDVERALCRLEKNDPSLEGILLDSEHLSFRALDAVASHSTLNRVDLECGAVYSLVWTPELLWPEETQDALINALKTNTSIKTIGIAMRKSRDLSAIIEVVKHSRGLEYLTIDFKKTSSDAAHIVAFAEALRKVVSLQSLTLKQWYMYHGCGGAALAHILDLPMKRLIISDGCTQGGSRYHCGSFEE
jgi:ankyrin repeat protein